jgi:hypothetical protein
MDRAHFRARQPVQGLMLRHVLLIACVLFIVASTTPTTWAQSTTATSPITVFLDCESCFHDFLQLEVGFVTYVRDPTDATVHVLITRQDTASGGREYTLSLLGRAPFDGEDHVLTTATTSSDPDDVIRRQLASALRVALLRYAVRGSVPPDLDVVVQRGDGEFGAGEPGDAWNQWVFSLRGSASFEGEESSQEQQFGASLSADRITPDWKTTFGLDIEHERQTFKLNGNGPVSVERDERELEWLAVKGFGDHVSFGAEGEVVSSTFDNITFGLAAAPAVEVNLYPYSAYTRRQLRAQYSLGARHLQYEEPTLFGRERETRPEHRTSLTFEQREPWGSLEASAEWRQYLDDLDKTRLEVEAEVSVRLAPGVSVAAQISTSRIRDQIALPARGATPEEVLLEIRRLQSGYEYEAYFSLTYTFGSIFSSIVNPRFGE